MSGSVRANRPDVFEPGAPLAVIVARDGRLPLGSDEAVAEARGAAIVIGTGSEQGAEALVAGARVWWAETGVGLRAGALAGALAPMLSASPLLILPASPDGRDLAPRLAAVLERPLVARAVCVDGTPHPTRPDDLRVRATVARLDDRVLVPMEVDGAAVVTLVPGSRSVTPVGLTRVQPLAWPESSDVGEGLDVEVVEVLQPDLQTMDLADAPRVVAGGAGLVAGLDDRRATEIFDLLGTVAAALGGSAGATRVATDAGWIDYARQIGTTGVTIDPDLYIAFGVSGATQHVGGLGTPRHIVSVNTDSSAPMTAMANLGLVTDAEGLLVELGRRLGVDVDQPAGAVAPEDHHG